MKRILIIACTIAVVLSLAGALVAKEITVQGRLQKTVEQGGWVIAAGKNKYLILNARNFQKETWFKESAEVEAIGETKPDVVTTYMEGTPFEVRTMHPVEQTGASADTAATRRVTRVMVATRNRRMRARAMLLFVLPKPRPGLERKSRLAAIACNPSGFTAKANHPP